MPYGRMVFNGFGPRSRLVDQSMADAAPVCGWIAAHCGADHLAADGMGADIHAARIEPDQHAMLRDDPVLAGKAFEEALRLEAPVQTFFRTTTADVDIGGVRVPECAKVLLLLGANRDHRRWPARTASTSPDARAGTSVSASASTPASAPG